MIWKEKGRPPTPFLRDNGLNAILSVPAGTLPTVAAQLPAQLSELAGLQCGVLSRRQIVCAGVSRGVLRSRMRRGSWQRLHPGVYPAFSGEPSRAATLWAAVLYAGPGAVLSHQTAAELVGLADARSSLIHVTVPVDRRACKQAGLVIHVSTRATAAIHPARTPPQTRVEETILDLWQAAPNLDDAVGWVTRGLGRRLTTQERLRTAAAARSRVRWRAQLTELLSPDAAGIHSVLEYRYLRYVERPHRLPVSRRQAHARRDGRSEYRDTLYEGYSTAIELDGRAAHPGDSRWRDIERDNAASVAGITTLRYGWRDVTATPCKVAAEIATVLAARGYTGARPCSADCPVGRLGPAEQPAGSPVPAARSGDIVRARPTRPVAPRSGPPKSGPQGGGPASGRQSGRPVSSGQDAGPVSGRQGARLLSGRQGARPVSGGGQAGGRPAKSRPRSQVPVARSR